MSVPFVSVIVPCRNEADFLGPCLDSVLGSAYPASRMEVLVADGRSEDSSREVIARYAARDARVRAVDNPRRATPAALNCALAEAQGEVVMRLDAHAAIEPDYIRLAVEALSDWKADNVGGAMSTIPQRPGPFAEAIRIALTHRFGVGNSRFRTGAAEPEWVDTVFAGCWPRAVFDLVGRFNEKLERSQDIEFSQRLRRAGGKILLVPAMRSRYYARATLGAFWRHNWSNGVWAVLPFAYADGMPVRWRHLVPLAFVAALGIGCAIGAPLWAAAPYVAVNLFCSWHAALRRRDGGLAWKLPVAFASLHLAYGAGSLWGVLRLALVAMRRP